MTAAPARALPPCALDPDMAAFVGMQPREATHGEVAALTLARFGETRAWTAEEVAAYHLARNPLPVPRGFIDRDAEMAAFVRDRAGRLKLDELLAALAAAFPGRRLPSRSALHRFLQGERRQLASLAAAAPPRRRLAG